MQAKYRELMVKVLKMYDPAEVNNWIDDETEHTDGDRDAALRIVADHVAEYGIDYYPKYFEFLKGLQNPAL